MVIKIRVFPVIVVIAVVREKHNSHLAKPLLLAGTQCRRFKVVKVFLIYRLSFTCCVKTLIPRQLFENLHINAQCKFLVVAIESAFEG